MKKNLSSGLQLTHSVHVSSCCLAQIFTVHCCWFHCATHSIIF